MVFPCIVIWIGQSSCSPLSKTRSYCRDMMYTQGMYVNGTVRRSASIEGGLARDKQKKCYVLLLFTLLFILSKIHFGDCPDTNPGAPGEATPSNHKAPPKDETQGRTGKGWGGNQPRRGRKGGEARQRPFWDAKVAQRLRGVGGMQRLRPSGWKEGWNAEKSLARKTKIK